MPKIVDIPPALPKRPYDKTDEETNADVAAQVKAHFAPKKPEPKPVYNEKTKKWAKSFLEQPSQISMNLESDYDLEIIKQAQKKKNHKCKKREASCPARSTEESIGRPAQSHFRPRQGLQSLNGYGHANNRP